MRVPILLVPKRVNILDGILAEKLESENLICQKKAGWREADLSLVRTRPIFISKLLIARGANLNYPKASSGLPKRRSRTPFSSKPPETFINSPHYIETRTGRVR